MAQRPVRYPSGVTTFPPRHMLATYPELPALGQIAVQEDFLPYLAGNYTVTTAVAGTVATFAKVGGATKLATSAGATDTIYLSRIGAGFQVMPFDQLWCDTRLVYPRSVANANDTNIYWGLFDNAVPTAATNGIYFFKAAGANAVAFVIKKGGVTTTFNNIGDITLPSGLFGDTNSVNAVLNAVVAGNLLTGVSVSNPGAGYYFTPLVLTTTTSGAAGLNLVSAGLGSTAFSTGNPSVPIQTTGLPYASIAAPYVASPGAGLTNSAGSLAYLEVEALLNFAFWYDGKGSLSVSVNGREVMSIVGTATAIGSVGIAAGGTATVSGSNNSFFSTTQLTAAVAPFQPPIGSPINLMPLLPLNYGVGFANTTANIRTMYVDEYNVAVEIN